MKAEIITIGDEILIGQVIDTNSAWLAQALNDIGIDVIQISSIKDEADHIVNALDEAKNRADIILMTGGLGPTNDDITRQTLATYFNEELVLDQAALDNIVRILSKRNIPVGKNNERQAWLPKNATVLQNARGTAPGMWIEENGVIYVVMPGVPYEMKSIMNHSVLPKLSQGYYLPAIVHHTFTVVNIPETILSHRLIDFEYELPSHFKLAYLPHLNILRLRLTARGTNLRVLESEMEVQCDKLRHVLQTDICAEGDETPVHALSKLLIENNLKIGTAESCTGGLVAQLLTSIPGSSVYFEGSVISYSYEVKETFLGVNHQQMLEKGAVSEEVVIQMAESLHKKLNLDYCIAISGIAGPGGGTPSKPVGTVWLCVLNKEKYETKLFHFHGDRNQIIERTANMAIDMVRRMILNLPLLNSY